MDFLILSFVAGTLTVLAPCVLPLLPVIIGGSIQDNQKIRPVIITMSLVVSIVLFTLLLKASTLFIEIPEVFWTYFSGGIIFVFALTLLFPRTWAQMLHKVKITKSLEQASKRTIVKNKDKRGIVPMIIIGAALGPVFASCSPTYFVILASVLPQNFTTGLVYLLAYATGLGMVMFLVAYAGQRIFIKLQVVSNPRGWFKKILGLIFLFVAIIIFTGYDKVIEAKVLDSTFNVTKIETRLLDKKLGGTESKQAESSLLTMKKKAPEFKGLKNWINSQPIETLESLRGKVVLIDFWTYSCINCIRTLDHNQALWEKYQDDDFVLIGVHAPEFAFEHNLANVKKETEKFGLTYPIVQDNNFETWRNYENHYWPAVYIIDKQGFIRYTHFGEGKYQEIDNVVEVLLEQAA